MNVDTHELRIIGLKEVSGMTKGLKGFYSPEYVELFYNRASGEVRGEMAI